MTDLHTLVDKTGAVTAVVVPVDLWREIEAAIETHHLLKTPAVRERLAGVLADDPRVGRVLERLGASDLGASEEE